MFNSLWDLGRIIKSLCWGLKDDEMLGKGVGKGR